MGVCAHAQVHTGTWVQSPSHKHSDIQRERRDRQTDRQKHTEIHGLRHTETGTYTWPKLECMTTQKKTLMVKLQLACFTVFLLWERKMDFPPFLKKMDFQNKCFSIYE